MRRCTHCNAPFEDGLVSCPVCGSDLSNQIEDNTPFASANDPSSDTVDYPPRLDGTVTDIGEQTVDIEAEEEFNLDIDPITEPAASSEDTDEYATVDLDEGAAENGKTNDGSTIDVPTDDSPTTDGTATDGTATVEFTGKADATVEMTPADVWTDDATIDLDSEEVELENDDVGDDQNTIVIDDQTEEQTPKPAGEATVEFVHSSDLTIDMYDETDSQDVGTIEIEDPQDAGNATVEFDGRSDLTVDVSEENASDDASTIEIMPSASSEFTSPPTGDHIPTVVLPDANEGQTLHDKTLEFSTFDTEQGTNDSKQLGTESRLNRLWEGVVGTSANPMHSLQGLGLQASDTVFEKVATRRVADAQIKEDPTADYQIINKLGEGAMGVVFSARQTGVNRVIALKTAKPNYQKNDESRRRFLYEAHITAELDHSNIVPIHELGSSEEGMLFYSMKLVQGTEWSRVIRQKTRDENLEIFMKVADAMAFAHSKGVIHRDLKPENTMLGRFGEVFVTDWGTAINLKKDSTTLSAPAAEGDKFFNVENGTGFRAGDSIAIHDGKEILERLQIKNVDSTNPSRFYLKKKLSRSFSLAENLKVLKVMNLAGTPCFMAPEMAGHQLPKIGTRSDIYILGAILFDIVTGKAPHTGSSVTQCLRAALKNDIIQADSDDPLLTIVYKAMATEPADRFQTVEELQDAVREYRRHAESITLTDRSDELLLRAVEHDDYEMFSRTIFGYRDAVELWPENEAAATGLSRARLAFGQCAFRKRDYDLVLQTLDTNVESEATLYAQAVAAKKRNEGREAKLKLLQKVIAAVVLFAVVGLSGLTLYAFRESTRATVAAAKEKEQKEKAEQLAEEKVLLAASEEQAKNRALEAQRAAENAALSETKAKEEAIAARLEAETAEQMAIAAKQMAEESALKEEIAKNAAVDAANLAKLRAAQIQLGEYNSSLALAKSQIESFDVAAGRQSLSRLKDLTSDVFFGKDPNFATWGWKRISLLSNSDLPYSKIPGVITASAFSTDRSLAVVGNDQGLVQVLTYGDRGLEQSEQIIEPDSKIIAIAVSPNGEEVVYSFSRNGENGMKRWRLGEQTTKPISAAENRLFQNMMFTTDGEYFLAGINGGIWIWDHQEAWFTKATPTRRVEGIRGELESLQGINSQVTLITVRFQNRLLIGLLDHQAGKTQMLSLPDSEPLALSSATHTLVENKILLGLSDNSLLIGTINPATAEIIDLVALDDKHRAPMTGALANGSGEVITVSADEPVAHVWRFVEGALQYDTYLTGTPGNLASVGLFAQDRVFGVDLDGTAIVWDVQKQKQGRRLQRISGGQRQEYLTPVLGVFAASGNGTAIAIDANGVVDLWSLSDGSTQPVDASRWSYFGHTPGVELVDSAVDLQRGVVVTAANLSNAERRYLDNPSDNWEFCIWELATGDMLRRWTNPNRASSSGGLPESIEQRISLVDDGRLILFASDSETRLTDLLTGEDTFRKTDFGSYFAVPNPNKPSLVMLVKRSGAVRLLDLNDDQSWDNAMYRQYALADPSDIPLRGVWSEDGRRFYLAFSSGGLAAFQWSGKQLDLTWSSRALDSTPEQADLSEALAPQGGRVQSHLDIDLITTQTGETDAVNVVTRTRGRDAMTQLVSLEFNSETGLVSLIEKQLAQGVQWLRQSNAGVPILNSQLHDVLRVDGRRIRSSLRVNGQTFVSTNSAQVYGLKDGQLSSMGYGRAALVSSTGSQDGKTIYALLADGAIWKFTADRSDQAAWERLSYEAPDGKQIKLSASGTQLLIQTDQQSRIVAADTGKVMHDLGELAAAEWDNSTTDRLAICRSDGCIEMFQEGATKKLAERVVITTQEKVVGLHFFKETWSNPQSPPRHHLLIQTENNSDGALQFVPLDDLPAEDDVFQAIQSGENANPVLTRIDKGTLVNTSPTEGILVTGAPSGTVTVWFATPTWESNPRQLFDLEGHRGASMTCLEFSGDGQTLITADNENRLYAWMSEDPATETND